MSERTALDIALDLDAASCSSFAKLEAAEALRRQHAEIKRLARKNAAYASLTKAQDAELSLHRDRAAAYRVAVKNIDSEREVNAILTAERDAAISEAVAAEREAHAAEIDRLKRERHHIYDLLARQAFICGLRAGKMDSAAICREVAERYPTDIFPHDGESLDCKSARMARLTAANIEREILRSGDA